MQKGASSTELVGELSRLDARKDGIEAIVRRNACREIEKLCEPCFFRASILRNRHEIIGARNHSTDGHE